MDRIFYDFKIPKHIYSDITGQATWHHKLVSEEIRERLLITLDPAYRVYCLP